jgi:hypothetical protein
MKPANAGLTRSAPLLASRSKATSDRRRLLAIDSTGATLRPVIGYPVNRLFLSEVGVSESAADEEHA